MALCAALAACSGRPVEPRRAEAPPVAAVEERAAVPAPPAPLEPPEPDPEAPTFEEAYIASTPDLRPPAGIASEPRLLLGMTRDEVAVWLGPPNLRREEPRSEVWQYATRGCVLHVFLYEAGSPPERRVSHYEIGGPDTAGSPPEPCFETLLHRDEAARL